MSLLKTLVSTTIVGAPTSTTMYTVEPSEEMVEAKGEFKDACGRLKTAAGEAVKKPGRAFKRKMSETTNVGGIRIKNGKAFNLVKTTLVTGTTTSTTASIDANSKKHLEEIHNQKSLSIYVEAMSEEELTEALERYNLLDGEDTTRSNSKTYIK